MRVRLYAFASASQTLGTPQRDWELDEGARVADLIRALESGVPGFGALRDRLAIAVDGDLARPETPLTDGCEVALLPPVSGG